jgi:lipoic acid synthetase
LLRRVKDAGIVAKTGIMVGIGERDEEVLALMDDVQKATRVKKKVSRDQGIEASSEEAGADSCDILTIGQYLQPTRNHLPLARWVTPNQFETFRAEGMSRGFKVVQSGALVRSSYHADDQADMLTGIDRKTHVTMESLIDGARRT